jgi:hypothetical protein
MLSKILECCGQHFHSTIIPEISHVMMENSHEGSKTLRITPCQRFLLVNLRVLVSSCPPYKTLAGGCGKKKAT